jgi:peptide/nickel transport system substrate-binding protein
VSRRVLTTGFVVALGLLACGRTEVKKPRPPVIDNTPRDGGTLVRRLDVDITTLNPILSGSRYDRYVLNYLFTPLVYLDRDLKPIAGLAESWDISDDGLLYRFELNPKATFSDGTPVLASDVVFTLRKIVDPASEAIQIISAFEQLDLARTRAVDDHTVEVGFKKPLATQLVLFNDLMVLPEHVYNKGNFRNDYIARAVGSGPYTLVRRGPGNEVLLTLRKDYWGERPHIQNITFKVVEDHATAWNALKRGDLDETLIASDTWMREQKNPALTSKIDFRRFYTLSYNLIAWNARHPPLDDRRVRRALAMCIPMDSVINDLYHGTARALSGPFTPDDWAYNPNVPVIRYDVEGAKKLFAAAGWVDRDNDGVLDKDGRPFKLDLIIMTGSATTMQFGQMVQQEMKKAGVQLELVTVEGSMAIQRILKGNYEAAYMGWDLDPDPDPFPLFHSSQAPPHGQNIVYYANAEADRLMEAGRRELDQAKRQEIYQRLHEVIAADQPYTWTIQVSSKWGINKRVRGVETSRGFGLFLWYPGEFAWWIAPDGAGR